MTPWVGTGVLVNAGVIPAKAGISLLGLLRQS
jgi:hypothetical protein